jgi:hypothetical protein
LLSGRTAGEAGPRTRPELLVGGGGSSAEVEARLVFFATHLTQPDTVHGTGRRKADLILAEVLVEMGLSFAISETAAPVKGVAYRTAVGSAGILGGGRSYGVERSRNAP